MITALIVFSVFVICLGAFPSSGNDPWDGN